MKLREIQKEAIALPERERADLVCRLLETLSPPSIGVSDEEVTERERELDNGDIQALSHEEFMRRVQKARG